MKTFKQFLAEMLTKSEVTKARNHITKNIMEPHGYQHHTTDFSGTYYKHKMQGDMVHVLVGSGIWHHSWHDGKRDRTASGGNIHDLHSHLKEFNKTGQGSPTPFVHKLK